MAKRGASQGRTRTAGRGGAKAGKGLLSQQMLDNAPVNVIYADRDLRIQYMNPASVRTLRGLEQYLPIKVDDMVGSVIDVFHKNPEHQRRLLADPKNLPHRAVIAVGPEKLDLLVSPIYDDRHTYIGAMVTWEVVTQKLKLEREMARVSSMMENAPVNVIYADRDLRIQYMNPASVKTLKGLEQYLPVKVDAMVGQVIDVFHKDPSHQRRILSDAKNLPHRAAISVGPETLDLLVSPVFDDKQIYVGAMVTWEVVTQKLKLEREMARVSSMMENSPVNVIYADRDLRIQYMNPASVRTLKGLEQHLPIRVDAMVGQVIDVFHKDPSHQRRILSDAKNLPHRAVISVGPEKLDLLVSAIFDLDRNYIGTMVTWEVVTAKLKLESEVARVSSMMENAPTNVIFCDRDLRIQYANPASLKTLRSLERHLPVRVDDLIGQSVDIFHRDPPHQRRLLSDPKNLPHRALIQLGDEQLSLLACPIFDQKGEYIGPMLTWEVVTEKIATERLTEEMAHRERDAAESLRTKVTDILAVVNSAADGDLRNAITVNGEDAIGRLGEGLARFFMDLRGSVSAIAENAQNLASASQELTTVAKQMSVSSSEATDQSVSVSAGAEQVSANVQSVASGAEEMGASIREIAKNAADAARVATQAVHVTEQTNKTVAKLGESSSEIGKVIKVITSIAQQTNLLALNATIEAARAGEAGKGFAVVANEVKELAKETAKATEEISQKIEAIQTDTQGAVQAIGEISSIIAQINEIQTAIAGAVEEQTATTNEISRNVVEAAKGTSEIARSISTVATTVRSTKEGALEVESAADLLQQMAETLHELVRRFTY